MAFLSSKLAQIMAFLALSLGMSPAFAALPAGVSEAIATAGSNLAAAATAIIVALIAFWGLRKLATKMGWW